jgi:hypothetical protein
VTDRWVDEPVRCGDPECPEPQPSAQPEADGSLRYYACECGYEFGHQQASQDEGACSLGIPEGIRIKYSATQPPGVLTLESGDERRSVFLGTTIRRRTE